MNEWLLELVHWSLKDLHLRFMMKVRLIPALAIAGSSRALIVQYYNLLIRVVLLNNLNEIIQTINLYYIAIHKLVFIDRTTYWNNLLLLIRLLLLDLTRLQRFFFHFDFFRQIITIINNLLRVINQILLIVYLRNLTF